MKARVLFAVAVAGLMVIMGPWVVGSARADNILWHFQDCGANTSCGTDSRSFLDDTSTFSITATGFTLTQTAPPLSTAGPADLFSKFTSGDPGETGLGLADTSENEIGTVQAIKLDFTNFLSQPNALPTIDIEISSIQTNEGFQVYKSTDLTTPIATGSGAGGVVQTLNFDTSALGTDIFFVTANFAVQTGTSHNNVLIEAASGTTKTIGVPEPATLVLLGVGLLGLGVTVRRRKA